MFAFKNRNLHVGESIKGESASLVWVRIKLQVRWLNSAIVVNVFGDKRVIGITEVIHNIDDVLWSLPIDWTLQHRIGHVGTVSHWNRHNGVPQTLKLGQKGTGRALNAYMLNRDIWVCGGVWPGVWSLSSIYLPNWMKSILQWTNCYINARAICIQL